MKPEPRALGIARSRAVDAAERIEELVLVFHWNADAAVVDDNLSKPIGSVAPLAQPQLHATSLSELDGIARQVDDDLTQGTAVGVQQHRLARRVDRELQPFALGLLAQRG